jgi:hypothetical protein
MSPQMPIWKNAYFNGTCSEEESEKCRIRITKINWIKPIVLYHNEICKSCYQIKLALYLAGYSKGSP